MAAYTQLCRVRENTAGSQELLKDADQDVREMARAELDELALERDELERKIRFLLLPKDPNDNKNIILEIRAGTGGDEAALFAGDLFRMYTRYAERQGWKVELLSAAEAEIGGFKEVIALISGEGVYSRLKFESGTHRVQRVPETEAQGRIHTSACTVAVLPEAEDVELQIDPSDLRVDVFRASGAGGQHVNKTESAVRITHLPTGVVVSLPGRKVPAQESGQGDEGPAGQAARRHDVPNSRPKWPPIARVRSAAATVASGSAPTISPRGAVPTTAST